MSASRALNWAGLLMSRMVFMISSGQLMILILCMGHRRQRQSSWTRSARKPHEELSWCVFCCAWVSWCAPACLGTELECCPEQIQKRVFSMQDGQLECRCDYHTVLLEGAQSTARLFAEKPRGRKGLRGIWLSREIIPHNHHHRGHGLAEEKVLAELLIAGYELP